MLSSNLMDPTLNAIGMPKFGSPQAYDAFIWSQNASASGVPETNSLRWQVDVLNSPNYNRPSASDFRNTGRITIHAVKVSKVTIFGMQSFSSRVEFL